MDGLTENGVREGIRVERGVAPYCHCRVAAIR